MEIENLMENDLVYYNGKPVRLNDLMKDFLQNWQTKDTENNQGKHVVWDFSSDKISPIEISEDILLKSNFVKTTPYGEVEFYYSKEDSEYYYNISIRPRRGEWFVCTEKFNIGRTAKYHNREFNGNIKYIHELQYILAISGIDKKIIV